MHAPVPISVDDLLATAVSLRAGYDITARSLKTLANSANSLLVRRQDHSSATRFAIVLRDQLTELLLIFVARERGGEKPCDRHDQA